MPSLSITSSPSLPASSWEVMPKDLFGLRTLTRKVISFWHPAVKALKEQEPRLATGVLMVGCPADPVGLARAARADTLVLNYRYVNRELVDAARRQDIKVIVWNIDDPEILQPYLAMNLYAICTNRPQEIINYVNSH